MKSLLVATMLFAVLPSNAVAGSPAQGPRYTAEQARAEFDRLDGNWQVNFATFQLASQMTYRFSAGKLTLENRYTPKPEHAPERDTVERYRYRIDLTQEPKRLYLVSDKPGSREDPYIYEFRDGQLWMKRISESDPNDADSLRPSRYGSSGWLMGLMSIK
jgi:uncharacterized protein (TIGR03067 family)